jgi:hypothetical protein
MDEGHYGVIVVLLALTALLLSSLPVSLVLLENLGMISEDDRHRIIDNLFLWCWLLGLFFAVFSIFKVRRISYLLVKILVWVFSPLAIIFCLLWAIIYLIALNFRW